MADADNRIIPLVDDDQGEGVKDPLTIDDLIKSGRYPPTATIFERFGTPKKIEVPRKPGGEPEARWELPEETG